MDNLEIENFEAGVFITPKVNFNFETGICILSGEAYE